jgi:hypothetical protein
MTIAHRTEAVLLEDGKLTVNNLPFRAGQTVEVIVLPAARPVVSADHPLRGMVLRYENPTGPVADSDWDVLQ